MSDPVIKGVKRPTPRPATRSATSSSKAKSRKLHAKAARPKPPAKRASAAKPSVRKAAKKSAAAPKATKKATKGKQAAPRPAKKAPPVKRGKAPARHAPAKSAQSAQSAKSAKRTAAQTAKRPAAAKARPTKTPVPSRPQTPPRPAPRPKPSQDEMAAIRAFERAHKEFTRGRFGDARQLFRALIEQHPHAAEVTARARIYLAIAESRMRTETALPRDPDALYDRGVIELNRGDYVGAQELFERALKREPEAAHIHYGLAAARARLGSIEPALEALTRALDLQPTLRIRAQHDLDLAPLRNEPEFERLIFAPRA